jgi:hypothetical protein
MHKAAAESGVPGFSFTPFMGRLPFLILHILSIPVKTFGCGYAALSASWTKKFYVLKIPLRSV